MAHRHTTILILIIGATLALGSHAFAQDKKGSSTAKEATSKKKKEAAKAKKKAEKAEKKKEKKAEKAKKKKEKKAKKAASGDITVLDAKTASSVEDRKPVGESTSFGKGDSVTVWMAIRNPKGPSSVKLVYLLDDKEVSTTEVDVGKSWRWRTWNTRTIGQPGAWKVDIRDEDDNSLKTLEFAVK